ncbi:serine/threonine protein phosphatase [Solimonas fluminis]|uniref:Serine/threonine protein phosphatase n=1 Tax=Solimonas fluminis TaxID=2086571 RepID=A0A2S5TL17_9GAMM|nr:metallophosphoesterase [Solimonas fluminis]PPE75671.1 serine/threonine protein phosphatase [Solimonas fluminis]
MKRRDLLKAGAPLLLAPWLPGCGSSSSYANGGQTPPGGSRNIARGLHASWTGDPHGSRAITWFTDGLNAPEGVVEFGQGHFSQTVRAVASQAYDIDVLTHRAELGGYDPGKPLQYRVRHGGDSLSATYTLKPMPRGAFRFAHFGDHGLSGFSRLVREGILSRGVDFVLIAGDLSYANGDQPVWDDWFNQLEHLSASVPVLCAAGNHEEKDGNGSAYKTRLSQPGNGRYYSYVLNNVQFVISTGGAFVADGTLLAELLWLETTLAQASLRRARGEIDFIAFVQHFTLWTDEEGRSPNNPTLVLLEENILLRYGVDLLLVGHDHEYQRSHAMAFGQPREGGYVQVCGGGGGVGIRSFSGQSAWSAAQHLRYSFIEYAVEGRSIKAQAWAVDTPELQPSRELTLIDEFELTARSPQARNDSVKPIRDAGSLLAQSGANWRYVEAHTRLRNAQHLKQAVWHEHA